MHGSSDCRFKVFTGKLGDDHGLRELSDRVAAFAEENQIASKSIGVEYLENAKQLILTLGYKKDEDFYPVKLHAENLGKIDVTGQDFSVIEDKMAEASDRVSNIICHELFINDDHDFEDFRPNSRKVSIRSLRVKIFLDNFKFAVIKRQSFRFFYQHKSFAFAFLLLD